MEQRRSDARRMRVRAGTPAWQLMEEESSGVDEVVAPSERLESVCALPKVRTLRDCGLCGIADSAGLRTLWDWRPTPRSSCVGPSDPHLRNLRNLLIGPLAVQPPMQPFL